MMKTLKEHISTILVKQPFVSNDDAERIADEILVETDITKQGHTDVIKLQAENNALRQNVTKLQARIKTLWEYKTDQSHELACLRSDMIRVKGQLEVCKSDRNADQQRIDKLERDLIIEQAAVRAAKMYDVHELHTRKAEIQLKITTLSQECDGIDRMLEGKCEG